MQGQEIFLFSKTLKHSPGPAKAPYLVVTGALSRRHRDRCVKLTTHCPLVLGLRSVAIYPQDSPYMTSWCGLGQLYLSIFIFTQINVVVRFN